MAKQGIHRLLCVFLVGSFLHAETEKVVKIEKIESSPVSTNKKVKLENDYVWKFGGNFKPEMFYAKNYSLLNNCNPEDRVWYMKHTIDVNAQLAYGEKTHGKSVVDFKGTLRDKSVWGNPASIASTTEADTKSLNEVARRHKHSLPLNFFWIRELWMQLSLAQTLGLSFENEHTFQIGLFPFKLGRGISLGDAYATGPEPLGFYSESIVDQYAGGMKFSGDIIDQVLNYDLYAAILQNKSDNLGVTGQRLYGQIIGRIESPERGFGVVNYVVAGRMKWHVFNDKKVRSHLHLEPYWLFNSAPEQKVIFRGDSRSKLGTLGLAGEYEGDRFSGGFDTAFNIGHQKVRSIDRNVVSLANYKGCVTEVNSHVRIDSPTGQRVPFIPGSASQKIIDDLRKEEKPLECKEDENGLCIGKASVPLCCCSEPTEVTLYNAADRYRDGYTNSFKGAMFVADMGAWIYKKDLQIAATVGAATGDDNPNEETKDGDYKGFIGLQEIYSGKRVKSAFVLGGAGRMRRPLSLPKTTQAPSRFSSNVSSFTNLVFCGSGLTWKPSSCKKRFMMNPNILAYWQEHATHKFDLTTKQESDAYASNYLGVEANLFMEYNFLKDLMGYCVTSFFFPGQHYNDIQGKPLNSLQVDRLDRYDRTGFTEERVPNIGHNIAYTFNVGLKFSF